MTTNDGTPKRVNIIPWKSPITVPAKIPATMARYWLQPCLPAEHGDDRRPEAADRTDREVDPAEQQHEHQPDRDQPHRRDLEHQVGEVGGGEEAYLLDLEDRPDQDQAR